MLEVERELAGTQRGHLGEPIDRGRQLLEVAGQHADLRGQLRMRGQRELLEVIGEQRERRDRVAELVTEDADELVARFESLLQRCAAAIAHRARLTRFRYLFGAGESSCNHAVPMFKNR